MKLTLIEIAFQTILRSFQIRVQCVKAAAVSESVCTVWCLLERSYGVCTVRG